MVVKCSKGIMLYPAIESVKVLKKYVKEEHYTVFDYEDWLLSIEPKVIYEC